LAGTQQLLAWPQRPLLTLNIDGGGVRSRCLAINSICKLLCQSQDWREVLLLIAQMAVQSAWSAGTHPLEILENPSIRRDDLVNTVNH
jgi:hypothetical protein